MFKAIWGFLSKQFCAVLGFFEKHIAAFFFKEMSVESMRSHAEKNRSKFSCYSFFGRNLYFVIPQNSRDLFSLLNKGDRSFFTSHADYVFDVRTLVSMTFEEKEVHKSILRNSLAAHKNNFLFMKIFRFINSFFQNKINENDRQPISILKLSRMFSVEVGFHALGFERIPEGSTNTLNEISKKIFSAIKNSMMPFSNTGIFRKLFLSGAKEEYAALVDDLMKLNKRVVEQELGQSDESGRLSYVAKLFQYHLDSQREFDDGEQPAQALLSRVDIWRQAISPILGFDNLYSLIVVGMVVLAGNLELRERVRFACKNLVIEGRYTFEELNNIRELRQFYLECLRVYPPVQTSYRRAETDLDITGGVIPENSYYLVDYFSSARDPSFWQCKHVEKFDLENASDEKQPHSFPFTPFSAGHNKCEGRKLTEVLFKQFFCLLLACYDFRVSVDVDLSAVFTNDQCGFFQLKNDVLFFFKKVEDSAECGENLAHSL